MKKLLILPAAVCMGVCLLLGACGSTSSVKRISAEKQRDLSGNWNDRDIRLVCEKLIAECIDSGSFNHFIRKNGRQPFVKLGTILNLSDEYIDTSIIANKFRNAIINSGELKFVANDGEVTALRKEQLNQADHVKVGTEAQVGNETAADFMLQGTVKTVVDQNGKTVQKTYYVDVQLFSVESSEIVWSAENSDIGKLLDRKSLKL